MEREEYQDTEIGRIPRDWKVVRLGEVVSFTNGKRPVLSENGQFPVYGANGIMGTSRDFLADNDYTLIIGRVGASGEVHLGIGKIWVSDNAIYSKSYTVEKVFMPFLYSLLVHRKLGRFALKTTHSLITQSFLQNFPLPLPPLPEQKKIAEILMTVDRKIELLRKKRELLGQVKKGLMEDLLTGRVRVLKLLGKEVEHGAVS